MVKEEKIEKIIKQGLEYCGSSFKDVRYFLIKALEELKKEKRKNKKEKKESFQNWKLDTKTNSLINLNFNQRKNIMGNIEKMISDENEKLKEDSESIFND